MNKNLTLISDVEAEPVQELWENWLLAGTVNYLVGDPGLGKSTAAYDWIARITTDNLMPDGSPCLMSGGAVVVAMEESLARIKGRFAANGADQSRIALIHKIVTRDHPPAKIAPVGPFELPTDFDILRDAIDEKQATFVLIDPWLTAMSASVHNWASQPARRLLMDLQNFAEETGVCILALNHWRRNTKHVTVEDMDGSAQLGKGARRAIGYYPDPTDPTRFIIRVIKSNDGQIPLDIMLRHNGNTVQYLTGLKELEQKRQEQLAWQYASTVVCGYLAQNPMRAYHPTELRALCGVSAFTMRGICRELANRGEIEDAGQGKYKANPYIVLPKQARSKRP
jgi:hypothetical protein